ncbi:hypothetical protein [Chenggangzhangella methanolivorans]|nr:hypothetical protein [Chenggangzhangella methanolivorans]
MSRLARQIEDRTASTASGPLLSISIAAAGRAVRLEPGSATFIGR